MKSKRINRVLSMGMACVMVLSLVSGPLEVHAAEIDWTPPVEVTVPMPEPSPEATPTHPTEEPSPAPSPEAPAVPTEEPEPTETPEVTATPIPSPTATPEVPVETPIPTESPAIPTPTPEAPEETPALDGEELPEFDEAMFMALMASGAYNINSGNVRLTSPGDYTITGDGNKTTNTISVTAAGTYNITITNVNIDCSATAGACAFLLSNGAKVTLTLAGTNNLSSGSKQAGLQVPVGTEVCITGDGILNAKGGTESNFSGAGIGGGTGQSAGRIEIQSGTITAIGGESAYYGAAGIGGGSAEGKVDADDVTLAHSSTTEILISGGNITAKGSDASYSGAAGIGGGSFGIGQNITISGGNVTAYGSPGNVTIGAAGIGGGCYGAGYGISISGGTVNSTCTQFALMTGAGIGGGVYGDGYNISVSGASTHVTTNSTTADCTQGAGIGGGGEGNGYNLTFSGGTVTANAPVRAAGIGGGSNGYGENINISGGTITVNHNSFSGNDYTHGAGIGGGAGKYGKDITITGGNVSANAPASGAGIGGGSYGDGVNISISGAATLVRATSGSYAAGIGGGYQGEGINLSIDGCTATNHPNVSGYAIYLSGATGIGSGRDSSGFDQTADAMQDVVVDSTLPTEAHRYNTNIKITNSNVRASANSSNGSGIGSGHSADGTEANKLWVDIQISNSKVDSNVTSYSTGIGAYTATYMDMSIKIQDCTEVIAGSSSYSSIGIGAYTLQHGNVEIDIKDCETLTTSGGPYGVAIGLGNSSRYITATINVLNCENVVANGYSGAAGIGTYATSDSDIDINITNCGQVTAYGQSYYSGTSSSSPGIGLGCNSDNNTATINIDGCTNALTVKSDYQSGLGTGYGCDNNSLNVSVTNCPVIQGQGGSYGAFIGTGQSNSNSTSEFNITDCGTITATTGRVGLGTGESDNGGSFAMNVVDCGDISVTSNDGYSTGIGSGNSNYNNTVEIKLERCGNITSDNISSFTGDNGWRPGARIGSGGSNYQNDVSVKLLNCGAISASSKAAMCAVIGTGTQNYNNKVSVTIERDASLEKLPITLKAQNIGTCIGRGYSNYASNAAYPTSLDVTIKNYGEISMTSLSSNVTGIGTGHNNYGNAASPLITNIAIENCGDISYDAQNQSYNTAVGTGYNTYNTCATSISIADSGNLALKLGSGSYSVGIGTGASYQINTSGNHIVSTTVRIERCGDIAITGTGSTQTGIGMGHNNRANDTNAKVSATVNVMDCGNISAQVGPYSVGIGVGRNSYASYGYTGIEFKCSIKIERCGDVSATSPHSSIGLGVAGGSNYGVSYNCSLDLDLIDCGNITANGQTESLTNGEANGVGIGVQQGYYTSYTNADHAGQSAIDIINCGDVTATGSTYGAAIGTSSNCYNDLGLTVTIASGTDGHTVTANSGAQAAAIGSGYNNTNQGRKATINITNYALNAASAGAVAIGCGNESTNGTVVLNLTDCAITMAPGKGAAMGLGNKSQGSAKLDATLTNCTGSFTAKDYGAGIGESANNSATIMALTINGGTITATGVGGGAGIGGGPIGTACTNIVTIDQNAKVTATGSSSNKSEYDVNGSSGNPYLDDIAKANILGAGAGIGGSNNQFGGAITIKSGMVDARGGSLLDYCAAGIGGGRKGDGGTIEIIGGDVHATGGACSDCGAAGIGGGVSGNGGKITIHAAPDASAVTQVTAIGGAGEKIGGAGIGGGPRGEGGTIKISGNVYVNAVGSSRGAGIGGGFIGGGGTVEIYSEHGHDPIVIAVGGLFDSAGIGGGANGSGGTLKLAGAPVLKVYGKSSSLAITSVIDMTGAAVSLFQGTVADVLSKKSDISLEEKGTENPPAAVAELPANYAAFSVTTPSEGTHNVHLTTDKKYLLATVLDSIEDFELTHASATEGRQLGVIRFFDVSFDTDGGSEVPTQSIRINRTITIPTPPTKAGNIFAGWFADRELTVNFDFSQPVTAEITAYAKWVEVSGEPYIVYHYKENLEGGWDIGTIEYGGAKPGELVTARPVVYTGFYEDTKNADRVATGTTAAGTTLTLKLYYKRTIVNVDVENAGVDYSSKLTAPYGSLIVLSKPTKEGYDFDKWTAEDGTVLEIGMPIKIEAMGNVIYANWVLQEGRAAYQVKHYLRSLEGAYVLRVAEDLSGTVGDSVTLTPNDYTGFHVNHSISDETATGIIQADNSLALRVYYDRDIITVKLLDTHNTAASVSVEYGAAANLPTPSWPGYTFNGWKRADGTIYKDGDTIETLGEAVTAQWSAGATTLYTVRYYKQDTKGETMEIVSLEDLQGAAGSTVNAAIREYPGFTYDKKSSNASGVVDAENPLILNIYYTRNTYTMTYRSNGGSSVAPQAGVYYQTLADTPEPPTKTGYDFAGWHTDTALMDKHSFAIPVTQDLTLYAKWTSRDDTAYTVLHFQQDVSGSGYTLSDTDELAGTTDATVTAVPKEYNGFHEHGEHSDRVPTAAVKPDGTTVLKVYYLRDLHKVTFDSNSGSAVKPVTGIRYEAAIAAPTAPTRTGYTFQHWCADEELKNEYDFETPITADMTLYALWLANTYVVTLNYQGATGGNSTASIGVTYDAAYGTLPTPTRDGYAFDGWFTAKQGGTEITAETTVKITANQILYARWTANTDTPYKVEYWRQNVDGKGYTKHETENLTATTDTTVTAEVKEYEGFSEDSANTGRVPSGQVAGNGSTVLKLYYTRHAHTLMVDRANGSVVETETVYYGAARVLPTDPARKGYTFEGWDVEGVDVESKKYAMPDNDVTITALWQAIDYSVTYKYTGTVPQGAPALPDGGKNHNIGDVLEVALAPTLDGYVLYGWLTKDVSIKDGKFTMPDGNVTFTGEWRTANYNVVYVYQGNVPDKAPKPPVDGAVHQVGDTVSMLSAPEFPGYEFSGWTASVQVNDDGEFIMPVGNVIFRGSWSPLTYSADFTYSGEAPDNAPQFPDLSGYKVGDMVAVPSVDPIEGYTFGGWQLNGEPIVGGAFPMPVGGATVVGVWVRNTYAVTYAYTGYVPKDVPNAPIMSKRYHMGDSVTVAAVPAAKGYTCSTWTTAEAAVANGSFTMPGHDVGFTAAWTVNSYSIRYELNGGTAGGTDKSAYTVETPSFTFSTPTRDGFTFGGWYADAGFTTSITGVTLGSTGDLTVYAKWTEKQKPVPPSGGGGGGGGGGGPVIPPAPEQPLNKTDHIAYIKGFGDGTVRPMAQITRAEVAQIFYRLLTDDARKKYGTTSNSFTDSNVGDWYNEAVSTLAAMGIVSGKGEGLFAPMDNITRAEFAAIAARFDSDIYVGPDKFSDIAASWAREEINRAAHKGWVTGDGTGAFRPNDLMTRSEAVVLINNLLERHINADGLLPGMLTFSDNKDKSAWYYYPIQEAANGHKYLPGKEVEVWTELTK